MTSKVLVVDTKYSQCASKMPEIFDFGGLDVSGKTVLIKPNLLFYTEPEQGLNTHPTLLKAIVEECERRGAKKVYLGDNAGQVMYGDSKSAFYESAGMEVLGDYYVNLGIDLEPYELKSVSHMVYISKLLRQVDVVINVPKFKTHGLVGISGATKNTFGYLPGAQKSKMHYLAKTYELFAKVLVEVHMIRKPDLNITDGIIGQEGRGPFSRKLRYMGQLLVSKDPVAADSVLCSMIGFQPSDIPHLRIAQEEGLGTYTDVEVIGKPRIMPDFVLPPNSDTPWAINGDNGVLTPSLIRDAHRTVIEVNPETCMQCGKCAEECPVGAIDMKEGFPVMNGTPCASCHACQEACPVKALVLQSTFTGEVRQAPFYK
ncbi:MAG: DUF362 domain-containing protein [Pyramidobacter sp.]|nr:DUF362 domain-containing protein [Pyramidobacter sp.]